MTLVFELTAKVIGVAVSRAMFVNVTVLVSMCVIAYIYGRSPSTSVVLQLLYRNVGWCGGM